MQGAYCTPDPIGPRQNERAHHLLQISVISFIIGREDTAC
jgi:hypothetical protein